MLLLPEVLSSGSASGEPASVPAAPAGGSSPEVLAQREAATLGACRTKYRQRYSGGGQLWPAVSCQLQQSAAAAVRTDDRHAVAAAVRADDSSSTQPPPRAGQTDGRSGASLKRSSGSGSVASGRRSAVV